MHGLYDKARCTAIGNGHVWRALRELTKYEEALAGPRGAWVCCRVHVVASRTCHVLAVRTHVLEAGSQSMPPT